MKKARSCTDGMIMVDDSDVGNMIELDGGTVPTCRCSEGVTVE